MAEWLRATDRGVVVHGDNLDVLRTLPDASCDLIYMDPPFNTGKVQRRTKLKTVRDEAGDRTGFGGQRYRTEVIDSAQFQDTFDDFVGFLAPRLLECKRLLKEHGTLYVHLDAREVHYVKVHLDTLFGRENFLSEIIWAYDYGGRPKDRFPNKHDTILVYAKKIKSHLFNHADIDRIPYMAPGLVGPEKAARGKLPTDVWWHTIVSPTGKEKLGWPTQKPIGILERIVRASSLENGIVLDPFGGSGTTGHAAHRLGRRFFLIDQHEGAIDVMKRRFAGSEGIRFATHKK